MLVGLAWGVNWRPAGYRVKVVWGARWRAWGVKTEVAVGLYHSLPPSAHHLAPHLPCRHFRRV